VRRSHLSKHDIKHVICKVDDRELGWKGPLPEDVVEFSDADVEWDISNQLLHPLWRMDMLMISRNLGLQTAASLPADFTRRGERPISSLGFANDATSAESAGRRR
jgi:hypothetical protein